MPYGLVIWDLRLVTSHPRAAILVQTKVREQQEPNMKGLISRTGLLAAVLLAGTLLPGVAACGNAEPTARTARHVIVDTDMSSDDIMALSYLLERPDISVRAITVEGTGVADGRSGAENARRLLRALGIHRRISIA